MSPYVAEAVRVLNDPEQTLSAKQVASELLRNAGFSEGDIRQIQQVPDLDPTEQYYVFYA